MMPLFGAEYEVEIHRDHMGWEGTQRDGSKILFTPHICSSHHDSGEDHRGWIDATILEMTVIGFYLPPVQVSISLTQASMFIEGLQAVGTWAHLNQELEEREGE